MGWRGTLAMLVVLGGLGLALYLSDDKVVDEPVLTDAVLDGRSLQDAGILRVQSGATAHVIEFESESATTWRVVEPVRDIASEAIVDQIRNAYDGAQLVVAYEPADVDARLLEETGLAEPRATFGAEWPDGKRVALAIGLPGPFGQDLFARRTEDGASGRIYRVQQALLNALQFTPEDARERSVFRTHGAQIDRFELRRKTAAGEDVVVLVQRGMQWAMEKPAPLRIDQGQAAGFVQAVLGLRIGDFLPGRPEPGLAPIDATMPPDAAIDVTGAFGVERVRLYFHHDRSAVIGHNELRDLWFACETRGYEQLIELPIQTLRATWLLTSAVDDLQVIRVQRPDGGVEVELERRDVGTFRLVRPIAIGADPTAVAELLQALRSLAVLEFVEDAADLDRFGLGADALVLEIEAKRNRPERLLIGKDAGPDRTWFRRADEPHVVTVPRAATDRVRRGFADYVTREVLHVEDGSRVRTIVRTTGDGRKVEFRRGDDGRWRRDGADEPLPIVADVFDMLRDLRAASVDVAERIGAVTAAGSVELVAASGQRVAQIGLATAADGRPLCSIADAPGVWFVLSARDGRDVMGLE